MSEQLAEICTVCRKPLLPVQQKSVLRAGGIPLGVVHAEPCLGIVRSTVRAGGLMALVGARKAFQKKFPIASAFFEKFAKLRREVLDGQA